MPEQVTTGDAAIRDTKIRSYPEATLGVDQHHDSSL